MTWRSRAVPLLCLGVLSGCSEADHGPNLASVPHGETPGLPAEAGAGGDTATAAGGDGSLSGAEPATPELGGAPSQDLEIAEVAAGGDATLDVATNVFLPPTSDFYVFDQAGVVARRRFALDSASLALLSFGADGTKPSPPVLDLPVAAAARGDELVVLELDQEDSLVAVSYDSQLEHGSAPLILAAAGTSTQALGGSATQNLAVWSEGARLHGQLFSAQGKQGVAFDFGPRSSADHGTAARAVWNGQHFVVVWTRLDADGKTLLSWGAIDDQGQPISSRNLLSSSASALRLEDAVALDDGRLAALLTLGSPAKNPALVFVDAFGNIDRTARVYRGATAAWSLASDGEGLLLAARSTRSQGVVRLLDADGEPQSRWLVVDDSALDSNFEPRVALFAADPGYGAVVRLTDGSAAVLDVDPAVLRPP